jgi:hypothetical protein
MDLNSPGGTGSRPALRRFRGRGQTRQGTEPTCVLPAMRCLVCSSRLGGAGLSQNRTSLRPEVPGDGGSAIPSRAAGVTPPAVVQAFSLHTLLSSGLCILQEALLLETMVRGRLLRDLASSFVEDHVDLTGVLINDRPPIVNRKLKSFAENLIRHRTMTWPESATRVCPVMVRALSEQRKTAASAMSRPLISRRRAVLFT